MEVDRSICDLWTITETLVYYKPKQLCNHLLHPPTHTPTTTPKRLLSPELWEGAFKGTSDSPQELWAAVSTLGAWGWREGACAWWGRTRSRCYSSWGLESGEWCNTQPSIYTHTCFPYAQCFFCSVSDIRTMSPWCMWDSFQSFFKLSLLKSYLMTNTLKVFYPLKKKSFEVASKVFRLLNHQWINKVKKLQNLRTLLFYNNLLYFSWLQRKVEG